MLFVSPNFVTLSPKFFFVFFLDAEEPQPHLPVTATKASPEGLIGAKPAHSPTSVPTAEPPAVDAGEHSLIKGHLRI